MFWINAGDWKLVPDPYDATDLVNHGIVKNTKNLNIKKLKSFTFVSYN